MILNNSQLQEHAREFALTTEVRRRKALSVKFWPTFRSDMNFLHRFAEQLTGHRPACTQPAEDWLLDHVSFIETQAQTVAREFPAGYLRKLPKLIKNGMPRVYALCSDYLDHVEGHYNVASFLAYIQAYQEVSVLKTDECWALQNAMRVVIIHRLAEDFQEVSYRNQVCTSVTGLLDGLRSTAKSLTDAEIRSLLNKRTGEKPLDPAEIVHLVQHLSEWDADVRSVKDWLSAHIDNNENSLEQMVSFEHRLQSTLQVTCGNLVTSLHVLEREPWRPVFTAISQVEQILVGNPPHEYKQLDESSRDLLRSRVVDAAKQLEVPETLVAQTAIRLSGKGDEGTLKSVKSVRSNGTFIPPSDTNSVRPRSANLAYYLLDANGMKSLRQELCQVAKPRRLPQLTIRRRPLASYLGAMTVWFAVLLVLGVLWTTYGTSPRVVSLLAAAVALVLPVTEWVVPLVHNMIEHCCKPTPLLRYDFSKTVPDDARTMVTMPIIWGELAEVDDVIMRLEVHYLGNRQQNLHFAVLADFPDSDSVTQAHDDQLVGYAAEKIRQLQNKYGKQKFFLFHRSRQYNPVDKVYMGWERKRGKLVEFAELLKGSRHTSFTTIVGDTALLEEIRYVFTVDHDTKLPIGVVSRLAGTLHFPFNRPRLNETQTRVVEGFGVLQPRIGISYESTQKSRFARLWAREPGIDPYAFAISNPYQDLFGQAIFVGKGIFDVDVFYKTLVQRIPDNQILSHDVLEGGFLRTGLTADIEVVEEYPTTIYEHQIRQHRWIRGDWQLLKWLGTRCKDREGNKQKIDLYGLTKWHIVDNMRRSLLSPVLFVVALLGLFALPGREAIWETIVMLTIFRPFLAGLFRTLTLQSGARTLHVLFVQNLFTLLTLPFEAVLSMDAILRSLFRMAVTRRNLLEWTTAAQMAKRNNHKTTFVYEPAGYILAGFFVVTAWLWGGRGDLAIGIVALCLWLSARPFARQLNLSPMPRDMTFVKSAEPELNRLARDIWSFYRKYVTEEESWLPPDNVQYHPKEIVAHRTSPTNIGLYLACVVAAQDLGYIDITEMLDRLERSLTTVEKLEKWRGHLLNWYDTRAAKAISPRYVSTVDSGNLVGCLIVVRQALEHLVLEHKHTDLRVNRETVAEKADFIDWMQSVTTRIDSFIRDTDFSALYNGSERLFSLGYHVDTKRLDKVLYDLLASEARQTSFIAIALGQVPVSHWFTLGRTMTLADGHKTLMSWSGTMFEYLLPNLFMRTYPNTIWDSTYQGVISRQQSYADSRKIPLGVSESGYYAFDYQHNYQYRAFGVPGLGFDRGLEQHVVATPYAAVLALPYAQTRALAALAQFEELGAKGAYGFYEAVDFSRQRLPRGHKHEIVQSFMAHHQGMSMLSITNLLKQDVMVKRFHSDLRVQSADLLLQERIPEKAALIEKPVGLSAPEPNLEHSEEEALRTYTHPTPTPEVDVLGNGHMTSVVTNDGNGYLGWNGHVITRWREDPVFDTSGVAVYLMDTLSDKVWSAASFPCKAARNVTAAFGLDKATFETEYDGISSQLDVVVSPETDAEIRRLRITNHTRDSRILEVTSFLELALASQAADSAHPAFSKLFVETSHDAKEQWLLAKRRAREEDEPETWAAHSVYASRYEAGDYEFETDRAAFIGRGCSLRDPGGLTQRLRGSTGSVADPAFIMRRTVQLPPEESTSIYFVTGVAESKEEVVSIMETLREPAQADHAFHLAWIRSQVDLRHMHLTQIQALFAHSLAGRLLYDGPHTELRQEAISNNTLGQTSLWPLGLSGDLPILTVSVRNKGDLPFVMQLAHQHQYLMKLGLQSDLVVLDEIEGSYQNKLIDQLRSELESRGIAPMERIVGLQVEQLEPSELTLLKSVSRVYLRAGGPSIHAQLQLDFASIRISKTIPLAITAALKPSTAQSPSADDTEFFNGWGGFIENGRAYQIHVHQGKYLSRPWTNVITNPNFGCILTELGTGYSWWRNSRECKVTPWTNDAVLDRPGEALYLRDLGSSDLWSAAPKPAGDERPYIVTHGFGFTEIHHIRTELSHTMKVTVPQQDPLKIIELQLENTSDFPKALSVTYYAEWVLGVMREQQAPYMLSSWDEETSSLMVRNQFQEDFRDAVGFMHISTSADETSTSWTSDRTNFIGRTGFDSAPAALYDNHLDKQTGIFSNSCGAVQKAISIPSGESVTVTILLGCTNSIDEVRSLVRKYDWNGTVRSIEGRPYYRALAEAKSHWDGIIGQLQVETPDRKMDILLNGWLLYQAQTSRLWARTAFYQAGGAFGFRDQIQDALAFLHADADITRHQILYHAQHQYEEGDVQHWWHEETHKGIRTRFSDDLLWLPYAVSRYIFQTGDSGILDERISFLTSDPLEDDELERYEDTVVSNEESSLLDHCLRAITHAMEYGEHGLPLMGIGDWNDGMNRIGAQGRGESVWLGWFLLDILKRFGSIDGVPQEDAEKLLHAAEKLQQNLNESAWDGGWFRRAFTDDGRWLGTIENKECRIDAIAQSWSVLSDGTSQQRQERAMRSFDRELVDRELNLARLLTKAFDETNPSPGYIQGYPPGIRENGGQYTHGVIWSIIAWTILKRHDKAFELFSMLNPISHTSTKEGVQAFGNEPYVMSADVYTAAPHEGRAGWSWYTGAASWMYQAGIEYVLGIQRQSDRLYIRPCVPRDWKSYSVSYRYKSSVYNIEVLCVHSHEDAAKWIIDHQQEVIQPYLKLDDDHQSHSVKVYAAPLSLDTVG
ncbi:GH36-type glycosyl hydrolase domain-containing protein [Alicyclobacillus sp. SO9]|uniref:GH36-type glycosyl hydrolase domain-containing protein n=1 Tax=Alicyclobacillus sp. SO9 TaxID=2665646 RepID=UPI0018E75B57|nr:glucoamylase family protein [Alicyclobacillus sp. SO9]QQE76851.1 carbohydrate-binding protein [Alicyclobacillus sp. SO9]